MPTECGKTRINLALGTFIIILHVHSQSILDHIIQLFQGEAVFGLLETLAMKCVLLGICERRVRRHIRNDPKVDGGFQIVRTNSKIKVEGFNTLSGESPRFHITRSWDYSRLILILLLQKRAN